MEAKTQPATQKVKWRGKEVCHNFCVCWRRGKGNRMLSVWHFYKKLLATIIFLFSQKFAWNSWWRKFPQINYVDLCLMFNTKKTKLLTNMWNKGIISVQIFHYKRFKADILENIPEWNFSPKVFREIHMCERGANARSNLRNWLILRRKLNYFHEDRTF